MPQQAEIPGKEELLRLYALKRDAIRRRLRDFSLVPEREYFYELIYCLLTPQSSAVNADRAVSVLREHNFESTDVDPEKLLHRPDYYIRFHKTKSKHLVLCRQNYQHIRKRLSEGGDAEEVREWLVMNVKGLGWKEASHFLRNIGYRELAILDRHILRNLLRYRAIHRVPKTLTPRIYKQIEQKFRTFSNRLGVPMDELDLLFWSMETGTILK